MQSEEICSDILEDLVDIQVQQSRVEDLQRAYLFRLKSVLKYLLETGNFHNIFAASC